MDNLFFIMPAAAILALLFALYKAICVLREDEGSKQMKSLSHAISKGAKAYLSRQYKTVGIFFSVVFVILLILSFVKINGVYMINRFTPFAFVSGGFFSALSGFIGMKIATSANARTAAGAQKSLNKGLKIAFSAGSVMGFVVVGLALLDISVWFILLKYVFKLVDGANYQPLVSAMLTFGMGASCMALFSRVGGGIFTKAADVGADLVGKVEVGIPEDDARNPAVIADNVGDNVGDVAGMGADLYESYVGSILSCLALAYTAYRSFNAMLVPILIASMGIICSIIGTFFVSTRENATQKQLLSSLRKGTYISTILIAILSFFIVKYIGGLSVGVFASVICGILTGILIGFFTEFFTSETYRPTKSLAKSAKTGSATLIIDGLSLGMLSTVAPILIISVSVILSFVFSGGSIISPIDMSKGLYGIALSAVAMLSTLGITLATDAYGPVADNAGGIAQMAGLDESVRSKTDALDSLGNTTAATGKGFAIGSAALTALALLSAFIDEVYRINPDISMDLALKITNPALLIGLFIGGMLPFLFAALTMRSVGKSAQSVVLEVRRQFKSISGIMEGKREPDYARCVDMCTKSALKEMLLPAIIVVAAPFAVGLTLGFTGVVGMLAGATVTGFLLAVMMSNAGGSWDNAKKSIEASKDAKGSRAHKASVVGDTVGDPLKDTAGPSINILIKLLSIVSIVAAAIISNTGISLL